MKRRAPFVRGVLAISIAFASSPAFAGTTETFSLGGHDVDLYVPANVAANASLVVMLHGCTQSKSDFENATQMNDLAENKGFYVVWPDQPVADNATKCWNWYDPADQARGSGEPSVIVAIVQTVESNHAIDPTRVYVAGISAGAAMSAILGATYPDVFAAIGVHSGLEYEAATTLAGGEAASVSGGPDGATQGDAIFSAMGVNARAMPVIVFHGTADTVVNVINGHQVITSYATADALALKVALASATSASGTAPGGRTYTHESTPAPDATELLAAYYVDGMEHAWSGGKLGGSFSDPTGPDATTIMWNFFSTHALASPPSLPPVDGGVVLMSDGGANGDAGPSNGAAPSGDANGEAGSGCACRATHAPADEKSLVLLLGSFFLLWRRRSRRAALGRGKVSNART